MTGDIDAASALKRHLPVLRYDSQGSFLADSPAILTDRVAITGDAANCVKRADGAVLASARRVQGKPTLSLAFLGWPTYSDGRRGARSDYLDAVGRDYVQQAREMHRAEYADRIHGRAVEAEDGGWWLQYWFFYLYNNKAFLGFGLHEGDWEMVQVRLDAGGQPRAMAFAQHSHGQRCSWEHVEKRGERPVVYVARGSQASYRSAGRHDAPIVPDHADGRGREVAGARLDVIAARAPDWVAWPGRWGSSRARSAAESNSPRGPAHQDKWADPATFHEECDEIRPGRSLAPDLPVGPPQPAIEVRREGDHAIVSYRFPEDAARPRPAWLVASVDAPDDALPPATQTWPVERPSGEIEHSLALEDRVYEVRASAADEHGNAGDVAVARLE